MHIRWHFDDTKVLAAWRVLEDLYQKGVVRAIGLSNVEVDQLQWLLPQVTVRPMVVQNPNNVFFPGHEAM